MPWLPPQPRQPNKILGEVAAPEITVSHSRAPARIPYDHITGRWVMSTSSKHLAWKLYDNNLQAMMNTSIPNMFNQLKGKWVHFLW